MKCDLALRSFSIGLPEGIVRVPVDSIADRDSALADELAARFGLPGDDVSADALGSVFTGLGAVLGESGMEFAGMGLFRSPDVPTRPAFVMLTGTRVPSKHESVAIAIAGLRELYGQQTAQAVETLLLPAGEAVAVVEEQLLEIPVDVHEPITMLIRRASAWFPDSRGTTLGMVSVISPSWQDWAHVCDLALDVFDSFTWED